MKILFCGDVVGRAGRDTITKYLPLLRKKLSLDFVIVNGENSASGFGITEQICNEFIAAGADVITGGDHVFDQKETYNFINGQQKLLRPHNFPKAVPGTGCRLFDAVNGKKILVVHLLGQVFMKFDLDSPFSCIEKELERYRLGSNVDAIIVDIHAEATAEKMGMGHFLDGRVSGVFGSHTHVPTADTMLLPGGTAFQTDAGMCGDYDSVIGFRKETSVQSFLTKVRMSKMEPAGGEGTLCAVYFETNDKGLATTVRPIKIGGKIGQSIDEITK